MSSPEQNRELTPIEKIEKMAAELLSGGHALTTPDVVPLNLDILEIVSTTLNFFLTSSNPQMAKLYDILET